MYAISTATVQKHNKKGALSQHQLMGIGLGYANVPLLASDLLSGIPIWIEDKKIKEAAGKLNIYYSEQVLVKKK
jgi:hypothetical protein